VQKICDRDNGIENPPSAYRLDVANFYTAELPMNRNVISGLLGMAFGTALAAANVLGQPQPTTNNATSGKVAAALLSKVDAR